MGASILEEAAIPGAISPGVDCQGAAASPGGASSPEGAASPGATGPQGAAYAKCIGTANHQANFLWTSWNLWVWPLSIVLARARGPLSCDASWHFHMQSKVRCEGRRAAACGIFYCWEVRSSLRHRSLMSSGVQQVPSVMHVFRFLLLIWGCQASIRLLIPPQAPLSLFFIDGAITVHEPQWHTVQGWQTPHWPSPWPLFSKRQA